MNLQIDLLKSDTGKCRIELKGRLDTHTAEQFDQKVATISASEFPVQIIDLKELDYISSAGLRSLFRAKKSLTSQGGQLLILHPQPQVRKVFDVVKALPTEGIFTSVQELDNYLDAVQKQAKAAQE